ncbi:hypothetical protein ASC64_18240 [Nocardioides sp. Root122]|nr:hypothetical protein ASC64_18240 [Nocardioides sp. Root122]
MVDVNIDSFDLVPDLIGWPIALVGLGRLAGRSPWFLLAAGSAVVGLAVSALHVVGAAGSLLGLLDALSGTGVVFGTCSAIIALVEAPEPRRTANLIRWWDLGLVVVAMASLPVLGADLGALAIVLVVLALAVAVWFMVFCWKQRHRPELMAAAVHAA